MSLAKVFEKIPRSPESVELLAAMPVADAHEVLGQCGLMAPKIRALVPGTRMCGQAITCITPPGDNLGVHIALHLAAAGDVLIISAVAPPNAGCWGAMTTRAAQARGLVGVVADGYARDAAEIQSTKFPLWARGFHAQGATKAKHDGVNIPTTCGGVHVRPGDIILADDDGVLVIPLECAEEVARRGRERAAYEAAGAERLRDHASTYDWLGLASLPGSMHGQWEPGPWDAR